MSGKGVPAALYSAFAGELVRSRTFRRRYTPERFSAGRRAGVDEHASCTSGSSRSTTARSATPYFDFKRATLHRWPTPGCRIRFAASTADTCHARSSCRACRSDRLPGVDLRRGHRSISRAGDCSCSAPTASYEAHAIAVRTRSSAADAAAGRLRQTATSHARRSRAAIVRRDLRRAVEEFRGDAPAPNDDMTAVVGEDHGRGRGCERRDVQSARTSKRTRDASRATVRCGVRSDAYLTQMAAPDRERLQRDGMRRCQRLPELRIPLTRRDRQQSTIKSRARRGLARNRGRDLARLAVRPVAVTQWSRGRSQGTRHGATASRTRDVAERR